MRGLSKSKNLNWKLVEGGGLGKNPFRGEGMDIFWKYTISKLPVNVILIVIAVIKSKSESIADSFYIDIIVLRFPPHHRLVGHHCHCHHHICYHLS